MPSSACKKSTLRSEEHTSELQSHDKLVCRLLLEKTEELREVRLGPKAPGAVRDGAGVSVRGRFRSCPRLKAPSPAFGVRVSLRQNFFFKFPGSPRNSPPFPTRPFPS